MQALILTETLLAFVTGRYGRYADPIRHATVLAVSDRKYPAIAASNMWCTVSISSPGLRRYWNMRICLPELRTLVWIMYPEILAHVFVRLASGSLPFPSSSTATMPLTRMYQLNGAPSYFPTRNGLLCPIIYDNVANGSFQATVWKTFCLTVFRGPAYAAFVHYLICRTLPRHLVKALSMSTTRSLSLMLRSRRS